MNAPNAVAVAIALAALWLSPGHALADPCAGTDGLAAGPVQAPLLDGQMGMPRRACAFSEVGAGGGAYLLIDTPNFYGQIRLAAELWGSFAVSENTELFGFMEVYRYQTVISSVSADVGGFGHLSLGVTHRYLTWNDLVLGATGRVTLPTAVDLYDHAWPIAVDLGANAEYRLVSWLAFHGQVGALFSAAATRADPQPRLAALITAGAAWQPVWRFALVAALQTTMGYADALDVFAASTAVRIAIVEGLWISLDATFPLAGRERALTAAALRITWQPSTAVDEDLDEGW